MQRVYSFVVPILLIFAIFTIGDAQTTEANPADSAKKSNQRPAETKLSQNRLMERPSKKWRVSA
jgi:hypothetical protein